LQFTAKYPTLRNVNVGLRSRRNERNPEHYRVRKANAERTIERLQQHRAELDRLHREICFNNTSLASALAALDKVLEALPGLPGNE
jgi:hypothetical protein